MRALLFRNPKSRTGGTDETLSARLRAGGVQTIEVILADDVDVPALVRRHRESIDRVIVAGGDGTLNRIAPSVMAAGLPLGIVPRGTGNDLARTLCVPLDEAGAVDVIVAGLTRRIDVGFVNGHLFFNVASIGLSAELAATLDPGLKRRFGRLGYAIAALRVLVRARRFRATISDGERAVQVRSYQIAVGNGRYYGAGNAVHVTATVDDGQLDLYSLEARSVLKLLLMARDFRHGLHGAWREVRTAHGTEFVIATQTPHAVNADGELVTQTPARFTVRRDAMVVFAPAV